MNLKAAAALILSASLTSCGIEEAVRKNDDRYLQPGALDTPLNGSYRTYSYDLMGKYRVVHQWPNTSACRYAALEHPPLPNGQRSLSYSVSAIYEDSGKTWQAAYKQWPRRDFDPWVRSVKVVSTRKGEEGKLVEVGLQPVCFETWWRTSHYLMINLHRASLQEYESSLLPAYKKAIWSTQQVNGLRWRVAKIPLSELGRNAPNSRGGPYQAWFVALGDSGYVMSIEMGASQESLAHPQTQAAIEAVHQRLVGSLKVERLTP